MADDTRLVLGARLEGHEQLLLALGRIQAWPDRGGKELLENLSSNAASWIRIYAPRGETGALLRHVDHTGPQWRPGGLGGGGSWEASAGVKTVLTNLGGSKIYPLYPEVGTAMEGRGYIYPREDRLPASTIATKRSRKQTGGVMTFQKQGEERKYRHRVRGQKPQRYVFAAFSQVSIYARLRLNTLGREIVRPG
jgi:hypothetical protein